MTHDSTRRTVLATGTAAIAATAVGCGGGGGSSSATTPATTATPPTTAATTGTGGPTGTPTPAGTPGQELARTSDIPVGGGKVFARQKIVVTQPTRNDFKAFSAICTHQGCTVGKVADGTIDCPCHGSRFHIADGSVAHGPAIRPLPAESITVKGNSIHLA
ncbi:Rieske (2Fe-2S) protein [Streptomyces sp. NPDC004629]|uniref:Rieske (2Fe-2S) protein n=1 Tax=Streptomyces sp. NPDC004629 TaxID=3364705 RepID=UPI00368DCE1B